MSVPVQKPGKSRQDYETPPDLIEAIGRRFGPITFDLAASANNAKAQRWFNEEADALAQPWHAHVNDAPPGGNGWLNPPFANIDPWAARCAETAPLLTMGRRILFLVPASVGSNWYAKHVHPHAYVLTLSPRIVFVGEEQGYPKDIILAVFGGGTGPGLAPWRWK